MQDICSDFIGMYKPSGRAAVLKKVFSVYNQNYHYTRWGDAPSDLYPPLICVHGFAQSSRSWREIAHALPGRVIYALDLIGHGMSDTPCDTEPYTLSQQGVSLLAFAEFVADQEKRCKPVMVGYSMGGRVMLAALVRQPDRFASCVSAVVLESVGLGPASKKDRTNAYEKEVDYARVLREKGLAFFMNTWQTLPLFATQQQLSPKLQKRVRAERLHNNAEALARTFEHAGHYSMPSRSVTLGALQDLVKKGLPLCSVAGKCDDQYVALTNLLSQQQGVRRLIVEGAGHNVHLEKPLCFAELFSVENASKTPSFA